MAAKRPRGLRRAWRTLLVCAVALAHLGVLFLLTLYPNPEPAPPVEPPRETYAVIPLKPSKPPETPRPKLARNRKKHEAQALVTPSPGATAPAAAPGPSWTLPSTGGHGSGPRDLPDPFAVREALRSSVGCDQEGLKLRPDEQARCADRTARWARKGKKIAPAADDPKRQAELEAEEEDNSRRAKWKSTYGPSGMAKDAPPPRSVNHPTSALDDPLPQ